MRCNTYNLEELVNIKYGKNQKKIFSKTGTVPIYGTGGLIGYGTQYLYNKPSILIGRKGSIEKIRYVEHPFWTVDTLFYTEINTNLVIPLYLYYKILLIDLSKYNEGTTIPSLRTETLNKLQFEIPNIEDQLKIVSIIRPIDLKIENNQQINHNLEEQAKAIYKKMFMDNTPKNSPQSRLEDIAEITMGQSPHGSSFNEKEQGRIFFQGRAEFGQRFPKVRLYTTEPSRIAKANDILISVRAPVGDINIAYKDCCIGRGLASIRAKNGCQSFMLYTMLSLKRKLDIFNAEGTVFGAINKQALNTLPVFVPIEEKIRTFERIVTPMDEIILNNYTEICKLEKIRDALLPKLMSGEIDVSAVEIGR